MNWPFIIALLFFGAPLLCYGFILAYLIKRLDNADARVLRLENYLSARKAQIKAGIEDGSLVKVRCKPDPDCKKCHGKGIIGKNTVTGYFIPCVCCA